VYKAILLSLLLHWSSLIFSQDALKYFTVKQGLSQNSVTSILRSKDGMLWVGTQDGLNRFDGYSFVHFRHDPDDSLSLSDQYVTAIHEDDQGNLWVGTRHGLNLLNKRNNVFLRIYPDEKSRNKVQSQTQTITNRAGNGLMAVIATNLYKLTDPKGKISQINKGNIDQDNIAFLNGNIWHLWDRGHICNIEHCGVTDHQQVSKRSAGQLLSDMLFADQQSKIWYVKLQENKSLIYVYDTRKNQWETKSFLIPSRITQMTFDHNNQPWLATEDGVFLQGPSGNFIPFKAGLQQISGKALVVYPDHEGLIWIGFADKGLALYNPSANVFRLESNDANNKTIFTSLELSDGSMLMGGTFGAGIKKKNSDKWEWVSREKVSASTVDGAGNIWLGTPGNGILVINKNKIFRFKKEKKNIPSNEVFHLQYDPRAKRVFASTKSGLSFFDEQRNEWKILNNAEQPEFSLPLSGTYVLHTLTDNNGNIWVSTNGGVDVLDPSLKISKQFSSDTDTSAIKRTIITGVAQDPTGGKWISTLSNGLYRYDDKGFKHYGIK
jgi:ligand-binding sensor domain-containing protein